MMVCAVAVAMAAGVLCAAIWGQDKPVTGGKTAGGIGAAVEQEVKGLGSEDFPERRRRSKRLRALIAEQVRQLRGNPGGAG